MLATVVLAEPVAVRHLETDARSKLRLSTLNGELLSEGDLVQHVHGSQVTTRVTFRFKDGSLHEETVVFTQEGEFRVITDRLVQTGPVFPRNVDLTIDGAKAPPDLANGILTVLLENGVRERPFTRVSWMAATPKPRLVKLEMKSAVSEPGSNGRTLTHYVLHVNVGGVGRFLAPMAGKQPPDVHVWIEGGDAPAFAKSEQPLYVGGPVLRIEAVP